MTTLLGSLNDSFVDSLLSVKLEIDLRDQTDVHISACKSGLHSDIAAVATHQAHDTDSILSGGGLDSCGVDELDGLSHGSVEAKAPVNKRHIVINGLRNSTDGNLVLFFAHRVLKGIDSSMRAISTDNVQLVNLLLLQSFDHLRSVEPTSRRAEYGTAEVLDALDLVVVQLNPEVVVLIETSVPPANSPYFLDIVFVLETFYDTLDYDIESRAEAAASDDGNASVLLLEDHLLPRSSSEELEAGLELDDVAEVLLLNDECVRLHEGLVRQRECVVRSILLLNQR
mmetsp:Transcript_35649/g.54539  ORF Transcript_35649/g.54539 Transcript_35649/m.54539 type:complete len:284 (-) Transcript_35649:394-1245(-)